MQANIIEINGQRVSGTAKRNFNTNQSYLIEKEDYFSVPYQEWSKILVV